MARVFLPVLLAVCLLAAASVEHPGGAAEAAQTQKVRVVARPAQLTTIKLTLAFLCIHSYEGAWDANTGNGYHGGLQMDATFERMYGTHLLRRKGHAENWTPAEQIQTAIRAERSGRGFAPWPATARKCGLL